MKTLAEIERLVSELNGGLGATWWQLPTYGLSRDSGYPHVEVADGLYHLIHMERGREISRSSTVSLDELLYWIFAEATSAMASEYELRHRVSGQDSRRLLFAKRLELLAKLNPDWAERQQAELEETLRNAPYHDQR